ncbi:thiaminase II [Piscibacillus sp. B03]|uniref:thiaminase II n=1 Tax=Piscibacillus sp. B03 TaxID=3457430 RepID=UPI003FCD64EA
MSFTEQLRHENDDLFKGIFNHPFVKGIGNGDVPVEAVKHYIKADYEYLNSFIKVYALAMVKSKRRSDFQFFNDQINFILNDETHPHHNFCNYANVEYESLQNYPLPPTADHYIKHMLFHAQNGSLAEIYSALLPCPWTYYEIALDLKQKVDINEDHPFYEWISFYDREDLKDLIQNLRNRLDSLAELADEDEKVLIKEAFRKSCELELKFWEMSYTCENWSESSEVSV